MRRKFKENRPSREVMRYLRLFYMGFDDSGRAIKYLSETGRKVS
jgi:hypothetical protein